MRGWKRPKKNKKPSSRSSYEEKIQRPESWQSTCFDFNHYLYHKVDADGEPDGDRFAIDIDGRPNPLQALDDNDDPIYPGMKDFDRQIGLFDGAFYCATYNHDGDGVGRRRVRNCAALVGELLDQDHDGIIDNELLGQKLRENRAHIAIVEKETDDDEDWLRLVFKMIHKKS